MDQERDSKCCIALTILDASQGLNVFSISGQCLVTCLKESNQQSIWSVNGALNLHSPPAPEILPFLHKPQLMGLIQNKTKGKRCCGLTRSAGLDPIQNHFCIVDVAGADR